MSANILPTKYHFIFLLTIDIHLNGNTMSADRFVFYTDNTTNRSILKLFVLSME